MKKTDRLVYVEQEAGERRESFSVEHAERILKMPNNGGWHLPEDSEFNFDKKNGITKRTSSGSAGAGQEKSNK